MPAPVNRFTPAHPANAPLPTDVVVYGPEIPSEADLRLLGNVDGRRVLDLGCGGGHAAIALARHGAKVIAVDESAEQVAAARRAAEETEVRVELHHAPLAELAFVRADTIDAVVSIYSLAGVDDLDRVFRQVHRVLKPEHPIVFSVPHPTYALIEPGGDPTRIVRAMHDRAPLAWSSGGVSGLDHPRTIGDLFTSLGRANFRVDTVLEPMPSPRSRGDHFTETMRWLPPTLVLRARKQGI